MANTVDLSYDLGNQERKDFTVVTPGDYLADVEDARIKETQDRLSKVLRLKFRISQASGPASECFIGAEIEDHISMRPEAGWRMAQFLDAAYGRQVAGGTIDLDDLLGKKVMLKVVIEKTNQGNDRNRVARFEPTTKWKAGPSPTPPASQPVAGSDKVSM